MSSPFRSPVEPSGMVRRCVTYLKSRLPASGIDPHGRITHEFLPRLHWIAARD
jgi:hypothetical protein